PELRGQLVERARRRQQLPDAGRRLVEQVHLAPARVEHYGLFFQLLKRKLAVSPPGPRRLRRAHRPAIRRIGIATSEPNSRARFPIRPGTGQVFPSREIAATLPRISLCRWFSKLSICDIASP